VVLAADLTGLTKTCLHSGTASGRVRL